MIASSDNTSQTRSGSLSRGAADRRRARSYQDDGADRVGGQDVILEGSAVTLGLHVGGTLVMELVKRWRSLLTGNSLQKTVHV